MIYTTEQMRGKIKDLIITFETEAVEFKEAKGRLFQKQLSKHWSRATSRHIIEMHFYAEPWLIYI